MGKDSRIEWTHHTFNPWWGCVKVSPACDHCYAEKWAHRLGANLWGAKTQRRFFTDAHWKEPLRWNRDAAAEGVRHRVFCASMADVFENRKDLVPHRRRLFDLIAQTPNLDWLLLTKRIHLVKKLLPAGYELPANVWLGTTVENQDQVRKRLPYLMEFASPSVRFVSCEPLLGPIDLRPYLVRSGSAQRIDWVIAGGESGPHARPMQPDWPQDLREQCQQAGVAFHFKQWGHWAPVKAASVKTKSHTVVEFARRDGSRVALAAMGKAKAGRELEGRYWDQFPRVG